MPDPLPLPAEPTPKSRRGLLVLGLILACAAVWLYGRHAASTIVSRQALVEGRTYSVPAPVTGVVRAVPVVEGQTVKNGELVLLMDDAPLRSALAEAREALAIARQGGVPSAEADPAARERRENADRQAELERAEEAAARETLEHWTAEHARAVLTLRNPAVSGPAREQAVADEASARRRVEAARHSLAETSRRRAEAEAAIIGGITHQEGCRVARPHRLPAGGAHKLSADAPIPILQRHAQRCHQYADDIARRGLHRLPGQQDMADQPPVLFRDKFQAGKKTASRPEFQHEILFRPVGDPGGFESGFHQLVYFRIIFFHSLAYCHAPSLAFRHQKAGGL